jgi:NhaP-type Na+/H+ or K+/H+ antiporter
MCEITLDLTSGVGQLSSKRANICPTPVMSAAGGLGFGLVTGWLAGRIALGSARPAVTAPALSTALVAVAAADGLLAGAVAVAGYVVAVVVAASGSIVWWRWLEARARQRS